MEKRRRLGRGLEDISHYFISSNLNKEDSPSPAAGGKSACRVISIVDLFDPYRGALLTSRIGLELCKRGIRTFLVDGDSRFPSIAFMFGLSFPGYSFRHYLSDEIIYTGPSGIKILAPRFSLKDITREEILDVSLMLESLISLERETDIILLKQYEDKIRLHIEGAIFLVPAIPAGTVMAYRKMKSFIAGMDGKGIGIIITDAINETVAMKAFERICKCLERYCGVKPCYFSHLSEASTYAVASIVSHISGTRLNDHTVTSRGRPFFEKLRYLIGEDILTGEEMASLLG